MFRRILAALAAAAIAMTVLGCGSSEPAQDSQGVTRTLSEDGTVLICTDEGCEPRDGVWAVLFASERDFYIELGSVFGEGSGVETAVLKTVYNGHVLQKLTITRETYLSHDTSMQTKCSFPEDLGYLFGYDAYELDEPIDYGEFDDDDTLANLYGTYGEQ